ncbi:hypothetical protein RSAG8_09580, partial [Rhizoctonia solani AG-8 WAC10335]
MSNLLAGQVCSPPEIPNYLKSVCELKSIVGPPKDDEVIRIHAVIRVANQAVNIPGMYDPTLLAELEEHLFDVQMAKYWSKHPCSAFPVNTIYTPPALPAHVSVNLEPISGAPSNEEIIKVQDAIRSYQQFSNVSSLFDPKVNMDLSQHLFDIQMASYIQRAGQNLSSRVTYETARPSSAGVAEPANTTRTTADTNNAGSGLDVFELHQTTQSSDLREVMERANRLVGHANLLMERSNQLVERSNQLIEQPNPPSEQFNQITERLNQILERSNEIAQQSNKPVERLGEVLGRINKVLVGIQHAIVRNHRGNTADAIDCLVNEKGETPAISETVCRWTFRAFSATYMNERLRVPVVIRGTTHNAYIPNEWLGEFLSFYGIGEDLRKEKSAFLLKDGKEEVARRRISNFLSSCLG